PELRAHGTPRRLGGIERLAGENFREQITHRPKMGRDGVAFNVDRRTALHVATPASEWHAMLAPHASLRTGIAGTDPLTAHIPPAVSAKREKYRTRRS